MATSQLPARKGSRGRSAGALTTADLIVLSLLAERAMHGYELLAEYERQEVTDWASVSKAQVYYAIQKLARLALIAETSPQNGETGHERTVYRPTERGRKSLRSSLAREEWARARTPQPFSTWLGLSIHADVVDVRRVLNARKDFLAEELARETSSLAFIRTLTTPRANVGDAIVRLVIEQLRVELDWVEGLLKTA